tara:strand:+ start:734 stop:2338 length:1605 start_codon:yes stop_codon:yes gene_type:complete
MNIILDCTLRDGGYYTNWNFENEQVKEYLNAIKIAGVNVVEIGYRTLNSKNYLGPFAYCPDSFIRSLDIPKGLKVSVMINSSDIVNEKNIQNSINKIFPYSCKESSIDIVRIAAKIEHLDNLKLVIESLKSKGYFICLNLMHAAQFLDNKAVLPNTFDDIPIDVLYLADSTGTLAPDTVESLINMIKEKWKGALGIHAHDNQGKALQNTLKAKENGVIWLDSTVLGMGRGPGNAKTEQLIIEMSGKGLSIKKLAKLQNCINNYFHKLLDTYKWGSNTYYYLSGKYQIHPSFITEMNNDGRYDSLDILSLIENIKFKDTRFFSNEKLLNAQNHYLTASKGKWMPENILKDKEVILLASGHSLIKMREMIQEFINQKNLCVISLNYNVGIDKSLIDFFVGIDPFRITVDIPSYQKVNIPLITPVTLLPEFIKDQISPNKLLDFGLEIKEREFEFYKTGCMIPNSLSLSYALSIANSGKAKYIYMAGFDGYPTGDSRNNEVEFTIQKYNTLSNKIAIRSITQTSYKNLPARNIYDPK